MVAGLARAAHRAGPGTLADKMGITAQALNKIMSGGMTRAKHLFDALAACPDVLDDVAALYKSKLVPQTTGTQTRSAPVIVAALHKIIEAEADGSMDHVELLEMEAELAAAEKTIGALRNRINEIRKPRSVA
jgi:hypothetical protein